jgi:hypothetical protein
MIPENIVVIFLRAGRFEKGAATMIDCPMQHLFSNVERISSAILHLHF